MIKKRSFLIYALTVMIGITFFAGSCLAVSPEVIDKWVKEFQPSILSDDELRQELEWFAKAAEPLAGLEIKTCAENIQTHTYESEVLAKAFTEITGIKATHDVIGEGDVVERFQTQLASGKTIYHAYVNDADLIGTHLRKKSAVVLSDYMKNEGKDFTSPWLDYPDDFLNPELGMDYEGNAIQIPDQQFPILYWFRYDLFTDPKYMQMFKDTYGYELGVPVNWAAYEDIAEFWTKHVKEIDGKPIWGHLDYGKKGPWLGWRFSDAWLSLAGAGDKGLPNGLPVDEWGIRVEDGIPVGATMKRGGALDSPAAIYALTFFVDMIKKYAPPYAAGLQWSEVGPIPGKGEIAQTIYYCGTFSSFPDYSTPNSPVCDEKGLPKWRMAPQPYGKYWQEGMKVGYQDAGSWTIPVNVTGKERAAAWLFSQFCISKSVSLKKFIVGRTPNRKSIVFHPMWNEETMKPYGGLIEFFRSPDRKLFTDTGLNVPDYPLMQEQWWHYISMAVTGEKTPAEAMQALAEKEDQLMARMRLPHLSPKLAEPKGEEYWLAQPGAPYPEIKEREKPVTIAYDEMVKRWKEKELR
jgi:glycerol transport system substrate-binding protein